MPSTGKHDDRSMPGSLLRRMMSLHLFTRKRSSAPKLARERPGPALDGPGQSVIGGTLGTLRTGIQGQDPKPGPVFFSDQESVASLTSVDTAETSVSTDQRMQRVPNTAPVSRACPAPLLHNHCHNQTPPGPHTLPRSFAPGGGTLVNRQVARAFNHAFLAGVRDDSLRINVLPRWNKSLGRGHGKNGTMGGSGWDSSDEEE
ncbi:hypothetical protein BC830DRAFT_1167140 [Chytriomyces sp. MP71]|nr:hypothetical protein BC830DRAFT_1167140 [Chytriomyces sp. MP71]